MAAYIRMLLNRGAGPNGRVVSEEGFALFSKRWIDAPAFGKGASYGYGIAVVEIDGHTVLRHTGGMVSFSSALHADLDAGLGSFASVHAAPGGYRPNAVGLHALAVLRSAREGRPLAEPPPFDDPSRVEKAGSYAGVFTSPEGRTLALEADGEALWLRADGERVRLVRAREAGQLLAPGSRFALFPIEIAREGDAVTEVAWGGEWYTGPAYKGPRTFETPAEWRACAGAYRNDSPWYGTARVVLRKGRLLAAGEPLVPLGGGVFRVGDDLTGTERVRFSDVVGGRAPADVLLGDRVPAGGRVARRRAVNPWGVVPATAHDRPAVGPGNQADAEPPEPAVPGAVQGMEAEEVAGARRGDDPVQAFRQVRRGDG